MPYTRVDSNTDDIEVSRSETSPDLAVAMDKGGRQSSRWKERGLSFKWSRSRPDSSLLNTILLAPGEEEVETSAKRWSTLDEEANGVTRMNSREPPEQYREKSAQKRRPSRLAINSGNNGSSRDAMGKRGRRDGSEKDRLGRPARLGAESTKKKTEKPSTEERAYTTKKTTKKPNSTAERAPSTTKGETTSPQAGQPAIKATRQSVFDTESVPDPSKQPPKRMLTPLIQKDGQTVPLKTVQKTGKALPKKPSEQQPTPKRRGVKKMLGGLFSRKKKKKEAAPPVETTRDTALAPLRDGKSVKEILKDLDNMSMMSPSEAGTRWSDSQSSDKMLAKARKYEKKALGLLSKLISDEKLARKDPHTDLAERDMIEKDPEKVVAMAKKAYEYAAEAKRLHEAARNSRKSRSAPFTFDQYSVGLESFNSSSELSLSTTSNLSFQRSLSRSVRSRSSNPAQNRTAATDSSMNEKTNEEDSNVLKMSSNDIFRTISQKCLPCSSGEDQLGAFYASEARNILITVSNEKDEDDGSIESSVIDMINGLVAATTDEPFPEPPPKSRISVVTTDAQEKKKERSAESLEPKVDETEPAEKENMVENSEDTTSEDKNDDLSAMVAEPNIVCYPIVAGLEAFRSCQNPNESQNERDVTVCKKASDVSSSWGSSAAPRSVDVTEASSGSYGSENNSRTTTGSGGVKSRGADSEPKLEHDDIDDWSAHSNRGSLGSEESYSDSDSDYSTDSGMLGWIQSFHD